ncbi:MAG: beta-propeller fold lactonase family protein [Deltaproteobacteria bacterium]|nr:beta-propeller fold lactonase family protein [Deltaproteobacteria bacterium]
MRAGVLLLACAAAAVSAPPAAARAARYRVVDMADTYSMPKAVLLSPDESTAYVTNFGRRDAKNVGIYRTDTLEETGVIEFEGNGVEMVITRDGSTLYVSNFRRGMVEVIDLATNTVAAEIEVGANPKTMAISADERTLYVSNWSSDDVSVVDLVERVEVRRLRVGHHPRGIAVSSSGVLVVGNHADHTLSFFDASTFDEIRDEVPCGRYPRHVIVSPDQRFFYVSAQVSAAVFQVDVATGEVLQKWPGGYSPKTIDISADGRWIFSAAYGAHEMVVIDTEDGTARDFTIDGIEKPCGLDATADGRRVYVTGWDDCHLYVMERDEEPPVEVPPAE